MYKTIYLYLVKEKNYLNFLKWKEKSNRSLVFLTGTYKMLHTKTVYTNLHDALTVFREIKMKTSDEQLEKPSGQLRKGIGDSLATSRDQKENPSCT